MTQVNMLEAKSELSRLVRMLENREEDVIFIARNNKVVADITLHREVKAAKRIGAAKGKFTVPEDFDAWDQEVEQMFGGEV